MEKKADALKSAAKNQIEGDVNKNKRDVTYGVTTRFDDLMVHGTNTGLAAYDSKNGTRFSSLTGAAAIANIDEGFNTTVLKDIRDKMMIAQTKGDYAKIGSSDQAALAGVRSAALEFKTVLGDNLGASVIADANNAVAGSNGQAITATNLNDANLVVNGVVSHSGGTPKVTKSAISELGDRIKITRAEVDRKRQEIRKKEEAASGGGKK